MTNSIKEIRIVIADDHPIVRQGLRQVIETAEGFKIVREAENGTEALESIKELKPEVAILDINMPGLDGFEVARAVRKEGLDTDLVFLTIHRDEAMFNEAIDLGAKGYVLKQSAVEDIVSAIKTVVKSQYYASPSLTTFLINRNRRSLDLGTKTPTIRDLTRTEKRILKMIAEDKTTKEIAKERFISPTTVEKHRANICRKLGLNGSFALLKFALKNKNELL